MLTRLSKVAGQINSVPGAVATKLLSHNIRELGLNKHKTRIHNNRYLLKHKKANTKNLIQLIKPEKNDSNYIRIATINVRSIKNK